MYNRYFIEGKMHSEKQLKALIYPNPNPKIIIYEEDLPF